MGAVRDDLPIVTNFQGVSIALLSRREFTGAFPLRTFARVGNGFDQTREKLMEFRGRGWIPWLFKIVERGSQLSRMVLGPVL